MTPSQPEVSFKVLHQKLAPNDEPPNYTFTANTKVGDAASAIAADLGYTGQPETFTLEYAGEVLDRKRPLTSYGIQDGDTVTLTSVGIAV